jgi:hypothetical protein
MSTVPSPYADAPRLPEGSDLGPALLVGADSPIELEIGPGRGGFLFERLAADPGVRIVGLEIRRKWATLVDRSRAPSRSPSSRSAAAAQVSPPSGLGSSGSSESSMSHAISCISNTGRGVETNSCHIGA